MNYDFGHLSDYIDLLQSRGKYTFHKTEALDNLHYSDDAFRSSMKRLAQKGRVTSLAQGFYLIIPLEYRNMEALPPDWYIDSLMKHMGISYYVGLTTAAGYHGASHQAPQSYQVVTNQTLRTLYIGRSKIQFYKNALLSRSKITTFKVPTGKLYLSTPEQTAFDLIKYTKASGGINRIATIFSELHESMDSEKLLEIAKADMPIACSQRLGYILDMVAPQHLIADLKNWIQTINPQYIPLKHSGEEFPSRQKNKDWKLIINEQIEPDL